jgi:glycosyltransferase involved in cell wall biosynthesis
MTAVRVLADATALPRDRGGVGRFVDEVLPLLAHDPRIELHVVCKPDDVDRFRASVGLVAVSAAPAATTRTWFRLLWEQVGLPRRARKIAADVVFSPHYTYPVAGGFGRVVVVHDLTFFSMPELHSRVKRWFFRSWIKSIARHGVSTVAPSEATASAFRALAGDRVPAPTVAPLGYDAQTFRPPDAERIAGFRARHEPLDRWIAFLGTLEPRKNVASLVEAFSTLASRYPRVTLLLAGGDGWDTAVPGAIDAARRRGADVRRLGYLPLDDIHVLLGGADLVVYPSLGEGFGLPVLEAMACGAAVVTTRRLSLPEVGGDAVAYVEPEAASIAAGLAGLLDDEARRAALRSDARARAAGFSWQRTADAIADALVAESVR